ncbi:MAG: hypothetical protein V1663_00750 [archaeon]
MPRCPNCQYILVLLEHRRKYKCAKCSRLYLQKEIDNNDFREWNKQQRKQDKETPRPRKLKLTKEEKNKRKKDYYLSHQKKLLEFSREHYEKNKDKILARKKVYRQETRQQYYEWRKKYRETNRERTRLLTRIQFWRQEQKKLAVHMLENYSYEASTLDFYGLLPAFVHSELLDITLLPYRLVKVHC